MCLPMWYKYFVATLNRLKNIYCKLSSLPMAICNPIFPVLVKTDSKLVNSFQTYLRLSDLTVVYNIPAYNKTKPFNILNAKKLFNVPFI